jgi:hypothetical protein
VLGLGASPERDHRLVLEAQHQITHLVALARFEQLDLQLYGGGVSASAQPDTRQFARHAPI